MGASRRTTAGEPHAAGDTHAPLAARILGSKSLTNRALLPAAAASGTSVLRAPLVSDDTLAFREAPRTLGVEVRVAPADARCRHGSPATAHDFEEQ
ncbi:hypothetical protein [Streptomyces sp. NPDC050121]|uniref:hypothetical protein n=1 Tax=Streptomyces sp. NPDC050121 TaxID=3365601 RepID=UPI0037B21605